MADIITGGYDRGLGHELRDLAASLDVDDASTTLRKIVDLAAHQIPGCDWSSVSIATERGMRTGASTGAVALRLDRAQYEADRGPCLDAAALATTVRAHDLSTDARWERFAAAAVGEGVLSAMSLPLIVDGVTLGSLNLYGVAPGTFDGDARKIGQSFAEPAAIALANAQAYTRTLDDVLTLQRRLLPERLPEVPGFELAVRYVPAVTGRSAGGDWYDCLSVGPRCLAVSIGDVAGHGLVAASAMGQLRSALRAYAVIDEDPGQALNWLACFVEHMDQRDVLATLCHMVINVPLGDRPVGSVTLQWASAGHPPPLIRSPKGTTHYLAGGPGPPVGVPGFASYPVSKSDLEPGSLVVLYTDGLIERPDEILDVGFARLAHALRTGPTDVDGLCDHILATLIGDGVKARDDIALLVIRLPHHRCRGA